MRMNSRRMSMRIALGVLVAGGLSLILATGCSSSIPGQQNPDQLVDGVSLAAASLGDDIYNEAAIIVSWGAPSGVPLTPQQYGGYVVGYEIYRSTTPQPSAMPSNLLAFLEGGAVTSYIDSSADPRPAETVTVSTNETTGFVAVNRSTGSGTAGVTYDAETITYEIVPSVPSTGQIYTYAVRVVTKKAGAQPFPGGTGSWDLSGQLTTSSTYRSTQATALGHAVLVDPPTVPDPGSRDVDIATSLFSWQAVTAADTYVLEFSTDRAFPEANTSRTGEFLLEQSPGTTISQRVGAGAVADSFANVTAPIYWRVGARNSEDSLFPRNRFGSPVEWVYSDSRSFYGLETPPPAP